MPYATRRRNADLNKAYSFLSEPSFGEAARALADKLVAMGFEEDEARDNIEPVQSAFDMDGNLFGPREQPAPVFTHAVTADPHVLQSLQAVAHEGFMAREGTGGQVEIAVTGRVDGGLEQEIYRALPVAERTRFAAALAAHRADIHERSSPAEQGQPFNVPRLMTEVQGTLEFADTDVLMEYHEWSLLDHSPKMGPDEFAIRETARSFEIDLDGRHVTYQFASETEQLVLDTHVEGWTPEGLVLWLDRQVRQPYIAQSDLLKWLRGPGWSPAPGTRHDPRRADALQVSACQ